MTAGLASFTVVVWLVARSLFEAASITDPDPVWLLVVAGFVPAVVVGLIIVSRALVSRARSRHTAAPLDDEEVADELQRLTLVRAALIESLGLFGCVIFLAAGQGIGLLLALACVAGLLLQFPTESRYQDFRETLTRPE